MTFCGLFALRFGNAQIQKRFLQEKGKIETQNVHYWAVIFLYLGSRETTTSVMILCRPVCEL